MTSVKRVMDIGARSSTLLENQIIRVLINDIGGMTPEFSIRSQAGYLNTHWIPFYRANASEPFDKKKHGDFWDTGLSYNVCGNFPCAPSFGPQHWDNGMWMPTHGWAANHVWQFKKSGYDSATTASYAISQMDSPESYFPLSMKKIDLVLEKQPVHYSLIRMYNHGDQPLEANIGYHNTVGSPFLQKGCIISLCADKFATPPLGGEFDDTGRLKVGAEFESLRHAPLRDGTFADISVVPSMIGYTDFVSGKIPENIRKGWSSVVNPNVKLAYICFFNGALNTGEDEIALAFNDLWLQFGGRNFIPYAPFEGAPDATYCLATENAVGAYATGLKNAKQTKQVLGAPTTFIIPPHSSKVLHYATLLLQYENDALDEGVNHIDAERSKLTVAGTSSAVSLEVDTEFSALKAIDQIQF